jgi:hypothetical protein
MAFDIYGFKKIGSVGFGSAWSYISADDLNTVLASNYFGSMYAATIVGDTISLPSHGSNVTLKITSVSTFSVDTALALETSLNNPVFTYTDGALTLITYGSGATKTLAYSSGVLSTITLVDGLLTFTKTLHYTDGILTSITEI